MSSNEPNLSDQIKKRITEFQKILEKGSIDDFNTFLNKNPKMALTTPFQDNKTTLHFAAQNKNPAILKELLTRVQTLKNKAEGQFNAQEFLDRRDKLNETAVIVAAKNAHQDHIIALIDAGASEQGVLNKLNLHKHNGVKNAIVQYLRDKEAKTIPQAPGFRWGPST